MAITGATAVHYPCRPENGFVPDPEEIARLWTPRCKAIVLINPNNPTGAVYSREVLTALARLAEKHGLRPAHVFASGAPAPPRYLVPSVAARPHEEFLELLRAIGFARAGVLEDEDAERHLLPAVKADFDLAARYTYAPDPLVALQQLAHHHRRQLHKLLRCH